MEKRVFRPFTIMQIPKIEKWLAEQSKKDLSCSRIGTVFLPSLRPLPGKENILCFSIFFWIRRTLSRENCSY